MPRFHRFRVQYPDIDTAILSNYQLADLQAGEADLALRYGDARWQGVEAEAILRFLVSPVCAPSLQQAIAGRPSAQALAAQDRTSVVSGTSVSGRVGIGGGCTIKKT